MTELQQDKASIEGLKLRTTNPDGSTVYVQNKSTQASTRNQQRINYNAVLIAYNASGQRTEFIARSPVQISRNNFGTQVTQHITYDARGGRPSVANVPIGGFDRERIAARKARREAEARGEEPPRRTVRPTRIRVLTRSQKQELGISPGRRVVVPVFAGTGVSASQEFDGGDIRFEPRKGGVTVGTFTPRREADKSLLVTEDFLGSPFGKRVTEAAVSTRADVVSIKGDVEFNFDAFQIDVERSRGEIGRSFVVGGREGEVFEFSPDFPKGRPTLRTRTEKQLEDFGILLEQERRQPEPLTPTFFGNVAELIAGRVGVGTGKISAGLGALGIPTFPEQSRADPLANIRANLLSTTGTQFTTFGVPTLEGAQQVLESASLTLRPTSRKIFDPVTRFLEGKIPSAQERLIEETLGSVPSDFGKKAADPFSFQDIFTPLDFTPKGINVVRRQFEVDVLKFGAGASREAAENPLQAALRTAEIASIVTVAGGLKLVAVKGVGMIPGLFRAAPHISTAIDIGFVSLLGFEAARVTQEIKASDDPATKFGEKFVSDVLPLIGAFKLAGLTGLPQTFAAKTEVELGILKTPRAGQPEIRRLLSTQLGKQINKIFGIRDPAIREVSGISEPTARNIQDLLAGEKGFVVKGSTTIRAGERPADIDVVVPGNLGKTSRRIADVLGGDVVRPQVDPRGEQVIVGGVQIDLGKFSDLVGSIRGVKPLFSFVSSRIKESPSGIKVITPETQLQFNVLGAFGIRGKQRPKDVARVKDILSFVTEGKLLIGAPPPRTPLFEFPKLFPGKAGTLRGGGGIRGIEDVLPSFVSRPPRTTTISLMPKEPRPSRVPVFAGLSEIFGISQPRPSAKSKPSDIIRSALSQVSTKPSGLGGGLSDILGTSGSKSTRSAITSIFGTSLSGRSGISGRSTSRSLSRIFGSPPTPPPPGGAFFFDDDPFGERKKRKRKGVRAGTRFTPDFTSLVLQVFKPQRTKGIFTGLEQRAIPIKFKKFFR